MIFRWNSRIYPHSLKLKEGFKDQIQYVIPASILTRLQGHPLLYSLFITDIGWYPCARYHYRERKQGAAEHILVLCVDGSGWYKIDHQTRVIQNHEVLLIPKGCVHSYGASEESPWTIHWVHFSGPVGDYYAHQQRDNGYTITVDAPTLAMVIRLFEDCYHTLAGGFAAPRLIYGAQVLHHLLGRLFFGNQDCSPGLPASRFRGITTSLQYLQENVDQPLTLADMAGHAGLSTAHFSHLFKQQTGYSPVDYFIHAKIQRACFLLDTTHLSIREVSRHVGYQDPYYFSRIFRKVMGVSPRSYRTSGRTA